MRFLLFFILIFTATLLFFEKPFDSDSLFEKFIYIHSLATAFLINLFSNTKDLYFSMKHDYIYISICIFFLFTTSVFYKRKYKDAKTKYLKLKEASNNISEGILFFDKDGNIKEINSAAEKILTLDKNPKHPHCLNKTVKIVSEKKIKEPFVKFLLKEYDKTDQIRKEFKGTLDIYGKKITCDFVLIKFESKEKYCLIIKKDSNLVNLSANSPFYDPLTSLPNRTNFLNHLQHAVITAKLKEANFAVLFIDLDFFKLINDTLGHHFGDKVLKEVATRIRLSLPSNAILARWGGDEFTALIPEYKNIAQISSICRKIIESICKPFNIEGHEFHLSSSIGISIFPIAAKDPQSLITNADIAMYRAKESGKSTFSFYTEELNKEINEDILIKNAIRKSIENEDFMLYYQPQINLENKKIVGAEVLLRWMHPKLGFISPERFIPIAENMGTILSLGEYVLKKSCEQIKKWQKEGLVPVKLGVNVSFKQFQNQNIAKNIDDILRKYEVSPNLLKIEITESIAMENESLTIKKIHELKELGLEISLDDFGTGYSSLFYLKKLPIDTLKIDKAFVKGLPQSHEDMTIISSISQIARTLGFTLVAEGIETKEQYSFIKKLGCDTGQGFYFGRPMPAEKFKDFLLYA
ncbi:EAL domain-containing protein [Nitrosophilus alvini]|uniref:EAL domain-containing protein n=1 Tax=Nitrosophilus alvini TaxID=2714855 RepID=UPI0019098F5B|nr:EAL domain-containing protein [Nitrosophilus alvini]